MTLPPDAFAHHPHLAELIEDPAASFFRNFDPEEIDVRVAEHGHGPDWRYADAAREELRRAEMAGRMDRDLWVFAYGSLMWNPALMFEEVRRAEVPGYLRRMCLVDNLGGRGTPEAPGLMAALSPGDGACTGLVFRIAAARLEEETMVLWRRERIRPGYLTTFVQAQTALGPVEAVTFVADYTEPQMREDLTAADQVALLRGGKGFFGTSLEYLEDLLRHLRAFDIHDAELEALHAEARAVA